VNRNKEKHKNMDRFDLYGQTAEQRSTAIDRLLGEFEIFKATVASALVGRFGRETQVNSDQNSGLRGGHSNYRVVQNAPRQVFGGPSSLAGEDALDRLFEK
jgi:hypothetical protein